MKLDNCTGRKPRVKEVSVILVSMFIQESQEPINRIGMSYLSHFLGCPECN